MTALFLVLTVPLTVFSQVAKTKHVSRKVILRDPCDPGKPALFIAIERGDSLLVRRLLATGAKVNQKPEDGSTGGETALTYAAELSNNPGLAEACEGPSYDINPSRVRVAACVNALIKAGADVNLTNWMGYSALETAAEYGGYDVVKLLLNAGAKVETFDNGECRNALLEAAARGYSDIVKLLLDAGANIEARDCNGHYVSDSNKKLNFATALIHASANGHVNVVKLLIGKGAKLDATDYWGKTAMAAASENDHTDVVKVLLDAGAKK